MSENKGASYKPFVPADKVVPELTVTVPPTPTWVSASV